MTWLKVDEGVSPNEGELTDWQDLSPNAVDCALAGPAERKPSHSGNRINFNPAVTFNNPGGAVHYVASSRLEGDKPITIASGYAVFQWAASGNTNGALVGSTVRNGNYGQIFFGNFGNNIVAGNRINGFYNWLTPVVNSPTLPHMAGYHIEGPAISEHSGTVDGISRTSSPKTAGASIPPLQLTPVIGATGLGSDSSNWSGYRGSAAEIILLDEVPNEARQAQIESYLALKYGITLDNGSSDYVDSSGQTFWDESHNLGFGSRITGIGRDDAQVLLQKQSKSQSPGAVATLALGSKIAESNAANPAANLADQAFFNFSEDNACIDYSVELAYADGATGKLKRMQRIHKAEITANWGGAPITLQIDGVPSTFNEQYVLAVSTNSDMSNAKLYPLSNGQITLSGGKLDRTARQAERGQNATRQPASSDRPGA